MARVWRFVGLLGAVALARAAAAGPLEQAFREADFIVDWRVRYESVDQQGFADDASAGTSRLRAGLKTAPVKKTSLLVEGVWVADVVDDYNSTTNGLTQYPVVADPADFTMVNRFALINKSLPHTTLTAGRQRIVLDDSRFVGNVGWRQNEQTFDALRAEIGGGSLRADVSYASQVNRVFGPDSPQGTWHGDVVLANVSRKLARGTLALFDYYVDLDNAAALSSNTLGARIAGSMPAGRHLASYTVSYARQQDAGRNPGSYEQHYWLLEGGLTFGKVGAGLGHERLGGDGANAFQTPLATLHAFQGWADKFLATPGAGIADSYAKVAYPFGKRGRFTSIGLSAYWHDFSAGVGGAHFGHETDVQLLARTRRVGLTLKYADYRADALLTDTSKLWLSLDYAL